MHSVFHKTNGYDKIQVEPISSWFSLTYGISMFIGGILSNVLPSHLLFTCSLLFASISLVGLAYSKGLSSLCLLWLFMDYVDTWIMSKSRRTSAN